MEVTDINRFPSKVCLRRLPASSGQSCGLFIAGRFPGCLACLRKHIWSLSDKPGIPGAKGIAVLWGELSAGATQRGRPRPVYDTWVAACCLAYGLPLGTLNVKDFADFAEHDGLVLVRA